MKREAPILRPAEHNSRYGSGVELCPVPRCGGRLEYQTNGHGRVVTWCGACAARIDQMAALRAAKTVVREVVRQPPPIVVKMVEHVPVEVVKHERVVVDRDGLLAALTDAEIVDLVGARFLGASRAAIERGVSTPTICAAARAGRIAAISVGPRGSVLVGRASLAAWRPRQGPGARGGGRNKLLNHLPRSPDRAVGVGELAECLGCTGQHIHWLLARLRPTGHLQRVHTGRRGTRSGPRFLYWWSGP